MKMSIAGARSALTLALLVGLPAGCGVGEAGARAEEFTTPELLPLSEQVQIREGWLEERHAMLPEMMRRHGIHMWIVVNEEFNNDPLTQLIAPPRPYAGNRDIFIFTDVGDRVRKVATTGYSEVNLQRFFESPNEPRPAAEVLKELYDEHQPLRIGLAIGSRRGQARSLTWESFNFLAEALGPEAASRFVSAADLIEEYLDTRIPEELEHYRLATELTEAIVRKAFSNDVITPGVTTIGDVRRFLYDQVWENRVTTWFQPDLRLQRRGMENTTSRGFLAVAPEHWVIERGDLIHVDYGITYMGLDTDWQKMAYVLREGETDAPGGLKAALSNTNALQDALTLRAARPGRAGGEVYRLTMAEMEQQGIRAQVYSHPLGNHGHGMGPSIDFRSAQRGDTEQLAQPLRPGSYMSIELNTITPVPEWDGQDVYIMAEDPAHLTSDGYRFFRPRQESFYLIR